MKAISSQALPAGSVAAGLLFLCVALGAVLQKPDPGREATPPAQETPSLNVMSFNIRFDNPGDGEHAWPHRQDRVASVIRFHRADVAGLQEALAGQIRDLQERLPGYDWVGVGRDDGEAAGEFSPIFYRTARLELLASGTFWLSETPGVAGSQSWDAALPRIATWARFRDRRTGAVFYHFNTHFDHVGETARLESARLLTSRAGARAEGAPLVVTGDFNAAPDSPPHAHLSEELTDAFLAAEAPHGPAGTYYGGFEVQPGAEGRRIDYIFVEGADGKEGGVVERFGTLTDQWRGRYPSDHLPILAELRLNGQ